MRKASEQVVWMREWDEAKEERRESRNEGRCKGPLGNKRKYLW